SQPDRKLEIVLLEFVFNNTSSKQAVGSSVSQSEVANDKPKPEPSVSVKVESQKDRESISKNRENISTENAKPAKTVNENVSKPTAFSSEAWPLVVAQVKKSNNTLYGILRMANASFDNGVLTLTFSFAFHQKQINEAKNRKIIEKIIKE